jgi:hypothetical protein
MKSVRPGTLVLAVVALALAGAVHAQEPTPAPSPAVPALAPAPSAPSAVVPPKTYYEAVQLTITGKSKAAGALVVVLQTIGGDPKSASVNVLAKTGENDIARDVAKELTVLAGSTFKVKTKSGNIVVISKAAKNSPNLSIALGMQTIPGIAVSFGED